MQKINSNQSKWLKVPSQRFAIRKKFLEDALENKYALNICAA